ncbi:MAG: GTP-binding protein [Nitrospina sp.]|jgi:G3E family GTPase|nr:GTP-binding protein [Nitrospina sp.]MBT6718443.1 GTP-binding protein [Nitrospina sp.]
MDNNNKELPVTLLSGFLGSGKTTLLNYILKQNHGKRIAVIENEFGEIGLDSEFVIGADEDIFEMSNGCICCSIRGDLIETLNRLLERQEKFDAIIIESTGLASSGPLAQAFLVEDELSHSLKLDGIITLVDSKHIWKNLNETEVTWEQIAFSNVILLNKTDLVSPDELVDLEKKVRQINPTAKIYHTNHAETDLDQILNIGGFDIKNVLDENSFSTHHHEADNGISSVSLTFPDFVDPSRLNHWLQMLFLMEGMDVFRGKGILNVKGSTNRYIFQSVYMMFEGRFDKPWGEDKPENKMVFIGQNLDAKRLEASLKNSIT